MSWWEPCRIKVSTHSLLPDTICGDCLEEITTYYAFIKKSLHSIIILESQFSIRQSCLKSKQKIEKSCYTDFEHKKFHKGVQTEAYLDIISGRSFNLEEYCSTFPQTSKYLEDLYKNDKNFVNLVDYDIDSDDSETISDNDGKVRFPSAYNFLSGTMDYSVICKIKNDANLQYRQDRIENVQPKIYDKSNTPKRKSKVPKKIESCVIEIDDEVENAGKKENYEEFICKSEALDERVNNETNGGLRNQVEKLSPLTYNCLRCDTFCQNASVLAAHTSECHGVDIADVVSSESGESLKEKPKKKLPNLVKISDLKRTDLNDDGSSNNQNEEPPCLLPSFVCSNCPGEFTNKSDLLMHSQSKHSHQAALLCGLCTQQCASLTNLKQHLELCSCKQKINERFICQVCRYSDNNIISLENHIIVHDFLIDDCRKKCKIFDPSDYVDVNENCNSDNSSSIVNNFTCNDCGVVFEMFKDFSNHRRTQHSIYHCDLCNKSYGRNSHLWKHVNKLHNGHPSITCQVCFKTSASKYHFAQHFNKTHLAKDVKQKVSNIKYEILTEVNQELEENITTDSDQEEMSNAPKEIDPSDNLYSNIITNYTPPPNEGVYKCAKCSKAFHKKPLLRKHKKNCRPKMQKDLLTRCKTCCRIFKDRQSLAKHLINYHSDYLCEICNQTVQSKCEIVSHIRFQHPDSELVCKLCKSILRSRNDMQDHLKYHSESHICQFCGDNLPDKVKLKMHILSLHRKILTLSCGICLRLFENQYVLKDHVTLLHKDQVTALTSCKVCGKNYGSKWKTFDHINKCHGQIFKACKVCLEIFNNDAQLQAHCDVTSHGPSSGFNTTVLRHTIMAMVKSVVEQNIENSNENNECATDIKEEDECYDTERAQPSLPQNDLKLTLLDNRLPSKRPLEEEHDTHYLATKKIKTDLKAEAIFGDVDLLPITASKRTVYINDTDPANCEICFKSWPAKKHLWQHYIRCHKVEAATVCGICLKTNGSYVELQKHLRENHLKLLHGQGCGSNFICKICGRYHNASSKLRLHMTIHANFDWNLMENGRISFNKHALDSDACIAVKSKVNYENIIEQVECSSNSEDDEEVRLEISKTENLSFLEEYLDNGSSSNVSDVDSDSGK